MLKHVKLIPKGNGNQSNSVTVILHHSSYLRKEKKNKTPYLNLKEEPLRDLLLCPSETCFGKFWTWHSGVTMLH